MALYQQFSNLKIRTKIMTSFCALVITLSSILAYVNYGNLKERIEDEFLTRVKSDASTFSTGVTEDLTFAMVEDVEKKVENRLKGSDLVAILVEDKANPEEDSHIYQVSKESGIAFNLSYEAMAEELNKKTDVHRSDGDVDSDRTLSSFVNNLKSNDQFGWSNIEINGQHHLVYARSGFGLDDEGKVSSIATAQIYMIYDMKRLQLIFADARSNAFTVMILAALISLIFGWWLGNFLTRPINRVVTVLKDIAEGEGDLSVRLRSDTEDEMGELCGWFNTFVSKLNDLITRIDKTSHLLNKQLRSLTANIELLQNNVNTTDKAFHAVAQVGESLRGEIHSINSGTETSHSEMEKVSDGARKMSNNISEVASSVQQSTQNLTDIASSVEKLSNTFQEIAQNMDESSATTTNAAKLSQEATDNVRVLDEHARNISDFMNIIDAISKQTNLLALNATIEAASAGDAGKGFAVVANEVKDLAKQTAQAVKEIATRVTEIQQSTNTTIEAIDQISKVMADVSNINSGIVATIEEQASTVQAIHQNLDSTSSEASAISDSMQNSLDIAISVSESCDAAFRNSASVLHVTRDIIGHSKMLADKSEEAKLSSVEMVNALGSSYTSVNDLSEAARSMLAITRKFKYIEEENNPS